MAKPWQPTMEQLQSNISGYSGSGYFALKALIWHGIRKPPGIFWIPAIFNIMIACILAPLLLFNYLIMKGKLDELFIFVNHEFMKGKLDQNVAKNYFKKMYEFYCQYLVYVIAVGLGYVTLGTNTLNDLLQTFGVVTSGTLMLVDMTKLTLLEQESSFNVVTTVAGFIVASSLLGLLDNRHIVDILYIINVGSSIMTTALFCTAHCLSRKTNTKLSKFIRSVASVPLVASTLYTNYVAITYTYKSPAVVICNLVPAILVWIETSIATYQMM